MLSQVLSSNEDQEGDSDKTENLEANMEKLEQTVLPSK